ncbi:hypothetical protein AAG906_019668 [Vitis piasezkii]
MTGLLRLGGDLESVLACSCWMSMLVVQAELRSPPIGTLKLKVNSFAFGNPGQLGIGEHDGEEDFAIVISWMLNEKQDEFNGSMCTVFIASVSPVGFQVHIADGIQFVREVAADGSSGKHGNNDAQCDAENKVISKFDILIIDVDSSDLSSGMTCPAADFVEESFLLTVKDSLSDQGLFVVNLVSRSRAIKNMVVSRMKAVFSHLFCLQLEEDVNEVLFALRTEDCIKEEWFAEAAVELEKLQIIRDSTEKIKCLK